MGRAETVQIDAAKRGATALEAHAWIVRARAYLDKDDSQQAWEDLKHVTAEPQALRVRVRYKIADGLAHYLLGEQENGKQRIDAARAETEKQSCVGLLLETKLARAQTLPPEESKPELEAIVRDAKAKNFGRIAKLGEAIIQQQ